MQLHFSLGQNPLTFPPFFGHLLNLFSQGGYLSVLSALSVEKSSMALRRGRNKREDFFPRLVHSNLQNRTNVLIKNRVFKSTEVIV